AGERAALIELPSWKDVPAPPKGQTEQLEGCSPLVHGLWTNAQILSDLLRLEHATILLDQPHPGVQAIKECSCKRVGGLHLFQEFRTSHRTEHSVEVVGSGGGVNQ